MAWAVATAVMVAACSGGATGPQQYQAWALDDGVVSKEEYHTAVSEFITCVRAAGFTVTEPMISPMDGLTLLYDVVPSGEPARWNEKLEGCNHHHLSHIEPAYVENAQHVMQPALRQGVAECLAAQGVRTTGSEQNATAFAAAADTRSLLVLQCMTSTARALYPELPQELKVLY